MEFAYVGIEVSDRPAMDQFLRDIVGLLPGAAIPGASSWRNDWRSQGIIVHDGPANDAVYFGIEYTAPEFPLALARLESIGATVVRGSSSEAAGRHVEEIAFATTPFGPRVELVVGLAQADTPYASPLVPDGFCTDGVGFGHLVFHMGSDEKLEEAHRFALSGLGMRQSDWFEGTIGSASVLARFYHCNRRHHSLALAKVPGEPPQALNHIMVQANSADSVVSAYDRAWSAGTSIDSGLGRHDNDRMFSFYVNTPAGFRLEFGTGAREIGEPWTENRRYDRPSVWGHLPVG